MGDRLGWVPLLQGCLGTALLGDISTDIVSTVDPLKKELHFKLTEPLPKNCWNPFQVLVHGHAIANDCVIQRIRKEQKNTYVAEVLLKRRSGPTMDTDPFDLEDSSSQRKAREFYEKLRHKHPVTI